MFKHQKHGAVALVALLAILATGVRAETAMETTATEPVIVDMQTSQGNIVLELYPEHAPITVRNFLEYVRAGYYDGTIYHRVIPDFMIQGGGFGPDLQRRETRDPIENEADNGLRNLRGTIAMARTSEINSATAQFFINLKDNGFLDHGQRNFGYAVFGRVSSGMDVVDRIGQLPTGRAGMHANVPTEPAMIETVQIRTAAAEEAEGEGASE